RGDAGPCRAHARFPRRYRPGPFVAVVAVAVALARGGQVELGNVLAEHPRGVVARQERGHRALGDLDPFGREPVVVAVVERDDLVLQYLVERARFLVVAAVRIEVGRGRLDGPAVAAVVALVPPAVQDRQVDDAVHP